MSHQKSHPPKSISESFLAVRGHIMENPDFSFTHHGLVSCTPGGCTSQVLPSQIMLHPSTLSGYKPAKRCAGGGGRVHTAMRGYPYLGKPTQTSSGAPTVGFGRGFSLIKFWLSWLPGHCKCSSSFPSSTSGFHEFGGVKGSDIPGSPLLDFYFPGNEP